MQQTVGQFLKEKLGNMSRWAAAELGGTLTTDIEQYVAKRTETECTYLASLLSTNSVLLSQRDWHGLSQLGEIPPQLLQVFHEIRKREDMHDKFWRYLELFAHSISNE